MKKIVILSLIQAIALFIITGLMCLFIRGDFFFRYLAPIFGLAAGLFRFLTAMVSKALAPALFEEDKKAD
ncbi:hypothetical protein [Streptococcus gordonii]|uniref:Excreted peptide n=1 Tax=Streptococcus gordonii TaxID=1302 RepID=A0AB35FWS7_STRGN|nr:hypothetical protein [Streptococcus gordonii]MBZ2128225.1 hypothetical protein [Streptococcus gordonii]MBZ2130288.1 hypothetical protein [Streptococcus gordonii]